MFILCIFFHTKSRLSHVFVSVDKKHNEPIDLAQITEL